MVVIVLRAVCHWIRIAVPDGLDARERVCKDLNPFVCGELVKGRMYDHKFRPQDSAGVVGAPCINVDSWAGGSMHNRSP